MTNPGAKSSGRVRFAGFEANLRTGELRRQGCTIPLPNKPHQVLAALAAVLLVASAAESQIPELVEVIEVRVVDVDVIVTDATGRPVSGLSADDFELLVAGEPTEIGYFTAIDGGRVIPSSRAPEALREPPQFSTVPTTRSRMTRLRMARTRFPECHSARSTACAKWMIPPACPMSLI